MREQTAPLGSNKIVNILSVVVILTVGITFANANSRVMDDRETLEIKKVSLPPLDGQKITPNGTWVENN